MLTKDLRIAPRANASLGATRAAFGAFPDHEVAPGVVRSGRALLAEAHDDEHQRHPVARLLARRSSRHCSWRAAGSGGSGAPG
jgi:hypothetical protein